VCSRRELLARFSGTNETTLTADPGLCEDGPQVVLDGVAGDDESLRDRTGVKAGDDLPLAPGKRVGAAEQLERLRRGRRAQRDRDLPAGLSLRRRSGCDPIVAGVSRLPRCDSDPARAPSDRELARADVVPMHRTQRLPSSGASVGRPSEHVMRVSRRASFSTGGGVCSVAAEGPSRRSRPRTRQ
jgi:hypothetical protein